MEPQNLGTSTAPNWKVVAKDVQDLAYLGGLVSPDIAWVGRKIFLEGQFFAGLKGIGRQFNSFFKKIGHLFTHKVEWKSNSDLVKDIERKVRHLKPVLSTALGTGQGDSTRISLINQAAADVRHAMNYLSQSKKANVAKNINELDAVVAASQEPDFSERFSISNHYYQNIMKVPFDEETHGEVEEWLINFLNAAEESEEVDFAEQGNKLFSEKLKLENQEPGLLTNRLIILNETSALLGTLDKQLIKDQKDIGEAETNILRKSVEDKLKLLNTWNAELLDGVEAPIKLTPHSTFSLQAESIQTSTFRHNLKKEAEDNLRRERSWEWYTNYSLPIFAGLGGSYLSSAVLGNFLSTDKGQANKPSQLPSNEPGTNSSQDRCDKFEAPKLNFDAKVIKLPSETSSNEVTSPFQCPVDGFNLPIHMPVKVPQSNSVIYQNSTLDSAFCPVENPQLRSDQPITIPAIQLRLPTNDANIAPKNITSNCDFPVVKPMISDQMEIVVQPSILAPKNQSGPKPVTFEAYDFQINNSSQLILNENTTSNQPTIQLTHPNGTGQPLKDQNSVALVTVNQQTKPSVLEGQNKSVPLTTDYKLIQSLPILENRGDPAWLPKLVGVAYLIQLAADFLLDSNENKATANAGAELQEVQRKEAELQEVQRKEAELQEVQRKEAELQEVQRKEAELQEVQRKEAELQEVQRKEAELQETQRKESEHKLNSGEPLREGNEHKIDPVVQNTSASKEETQLSHKARVRNTNAKKERKVVENKKKARQEKQNKISKAKTPLAPAQIDTVAKDEQKELQKLYAEKLAVKEAAENKKLAAENKKLYDIINATIETTKKELRLELETNNSAEKVKYSQKHNRINTHEADAVIEKKVKLDESNVNFEPERIDQSVLDFLTKSGIFDEYYNQLQENLTKSTGNLEIDNKQQNDDFIDFITKSGMLPDLKDLVNSDYQDENAENDFNELLSKSCISLPPQSEIKINEDVKSGQSQGINSIDEKNDIEDKQKYHTVKDIEEYVNSMFIAGLEMANRVDEDIKGRISNLSLKEESKEKLYELAKKTDSLVSGILSRQPVSNEKLRGIFGNNIEIAHGRNDTIITDVKQLIVEDAECMIACINQYYNALESERKSLEKSESIEKGAEPITPKLNDLYNTFNQIRMNKMLEHPIWSMDGWYSAPLSFENIPQMISGFIRADKGIGVYSSSAKRNRDEITAVLPNFFHTTFKPIATNSTPQVIPSLNATRSASPYETYQPNLEEREKATRKMMRQVLAHHAEAYIKRQKSLGLKVEKKIPFQWVALLTDSTVVNLAVQFAPYDYLNIIKRVLKHQVSNIDNEQEMLIATVKALKSFEGEKFVIDGETITFDLMIWNAPCNNLQNKLLIASPGTTESQINAESMTKTDKYIQTTVDQIDNALKVYSISPGLQEEVNQAVENKRSKDPTKVADRQLWQKYAIELAALTRFESRSKRVKDDAEYLSLIEKQECILDLQRDIKEIINKNLLGYLPELDYNRQALSSRLLTLGSLLEYAQHFGCRSAKDRTAYADLEAKIQSLLAQREGRCPAYWEQEHLDYIQTYRRTLMEKSGNLYEIPAANVGANLGINAAECHNYPYPQEKYDDNVKVAADEERRKYTGASKDLFERDILPSGKSGH